MTPDEQDLFTETGREPLEFMVGMDALTVIVNPVNNRIKDVTLDELKKLFLARRWSDVNPSWPEAEITHIVPNQEDDAFAFFVDKVFDANRTRLIEAPNTKFATNNEDLVELVKANAGAIGFLAFDSYQENAGSLGYLTVNGIGPEVSTVGTGEYVLARPLYLYTDSHTVIGKAQVQALLSYYLQNTNRYIQKTGYFPVSPVSLDKSKTLLLKSSVKKKKKKNP